MAYDMFTDPAAVTTRILRALSLHAAVQHPLTPLLVLSAQGPGEAVREEAGAAEARGGADPGGAAGAGRGAAP